MLDPFATTLLAAWLHPGNVQAGAKTDDPSPHQVRLVTVDSSVRLEVLDWGGTGPPLVFVGCYLSAHVFDDIAPKLRDRFHVYAITRRGIFPSDQPPTGYDPQRRADDVMEVIEKLGLQRPLLVGNACGGHILHTLGAQHPDRIRGLIYADAAEDPTLKLTDYALPPHDRVNVAAFRGKPVPVTFPPAERRRLEEHPIDPAIRKAITEDHLVRPDYAAIEVPVLAIYRSTTLEQALEDFPPRNEREREAVELAVAARRAVLTKWQNDLRAGVPGARIVELPGANLFMFLSHEADVVREILSFAATLTASTGRLVDLGSHRLWLDCTGAGTGPVIVFEAGGGGTSTEWDEVRRRLGPTMRTCAYDRAGSGRSDKGPEPRTLRQEAFELRALLAAAKIDGPYVLVGHSLGGVLVRLAARELGDRVAGMVLVEPTHESAVLGSLRYGGMVRLREKATGRPIPEPRLSLPLAGGDPDVDYLAEELAGIYAARQRQPQPLGAMPLVVLGGGRRPAPPRGVAPDAWAKLRAEREEQVRDLAGLSSNSRFQLAPDAGHQLHRDNPDLVVQAIADVVEAITKRGRVRGPSR